MACCSIKELSSRPTIRFAFSCSNRAWIFIGLYNRKSTRWASSAKFDSETRRCYQQILSISPPAICIASSILWQFCPLLLDGNNWSDMLLQSQPQDLVGCRKQKWGIWCMLRGSRKWSGINAVWGTRGSFEKQENKIRYMCWIINREVS